MAASTDSKNIPAGRAGRAVQTTYTGRLLKRRLVDRYGKMSARKWARAVSRDAGVNLTHGTLQRALDGIEPKRPELRLALGYPALVPTPACAECGVVHISKRCPTRRKAPAGPRRDWKRLAIWLYIAWQATSNQKEMSK